MEIKMIIRFFLLAALFLIDISSHAASLDCPCEVVKVVDGDTVHVVDMNKYRIKIRLAGIDAPERKQAFGDKSTKNLRSLVSGKLIDVEYNKEDRYGRIVGKLLFNGQDINLQQVKDGFAWHYKYYQREQSPLDRESYADAEKSAMKLGLGLWKDDNPIAPWLFRKVNRN